jgi:hypothetical protein
VLSRITTEGARALDLRPGSHVWALVKAVSTRGHAFRAPEDLTGATACFMPPIGV